MHRFSARPSLSDGQRPLGRDFSRQRRTRHAWTSLYALRWSAGGCVRSCELQSRQRVWYSVGPQAE